MVIERVITKSGVVYHPKYSYNCATRRLMFEYMEPFYYKMAYTIDGEEFILGSTENGKTDTLIEVTTGSVALRKIEVGSFTNNNIICGLTKKLKRNPCCTLHDVIVNFQNNLSAHSIELWKINLVIS